MKLRKLLAAAAATMMALGAAARVPGDILIFINPGHGGHDSDDRNVVIYPYEQGDPEGYWESNSNLTKGLWLRTMLEAKGYRVKMSRTTNTTADDLKLGTISEMANQAGADLFFSIHSNATGTQQRVNFPLMLHRGWDKDADNPEDYVIANILNRHLLENAATYWSDPSINVRGDWSFYNWGYKVGLGVLSGLTVTGMLSEGSFHDYIPETYRLMNEDFCRLEAWHFRRAVDEYFEQPGESVGQVAGRINDSRLPREGQDIFLGADKFATVQSATVELIDASGNVVDTYTTHGVLTNGIYAFRDVAPGKYHLKVTAPTYYGDEADIEVKADAITYTNFQLKRVRDTPPTVVSHTPDWKQGDVPVLCNTPISIRFSWDMDVDATEKAFSITPAVKGKFTWSDLNYVMTFTPTEPYDVSTLYTVKLTAEAAHAGGMKMEQPYEFTFLTADRNYMHATRVWPAQNSQVYYKDAAVELRLDALPDGSDVLSNITCVDSKGQTVSFNPTGKKVSSARSRYGFIRLPFSGDLTPGETYTVTFSHKISDRDGLTLPEDIVTTFTACDYEEACFGETIITVTDLAANLTVDAAAGNDVKKATLSTSSKIKINSAKSVSLAYEFDGTEGGKVVLAYNAPERVAATGYVFLVFGDMSNNMLKVRVNDESMELGKLNFYGWKLLEIYLSGRQMQFNGFEIEQTPGADTVDGTIYIEEVSRSNLVGVTDIESDADATVTVHPNPASEYFIANAGSHIQGLELISMGGTVVARTEGNVLNVMDIPAGNYLLRVYAAGNTVVEKVIVTH